MAARTRQESAEKMENEALQLDRIVPSKRESEFTQGATITAAAAKQRLLSGMSKIEAACGVKISANAKEQLADKVSRQILLQCESGEIEAKIKDVLGALSDISKAAGKKADWAFANIGCDQTISSGHGVANKNPINIVRHPSEYAQIAQAASPGVEGNVGWAFSELGGEPSATQFDRRPSDYVQAAQVGKGEADKVFQFLAKPEVFSLLDAHPSEFMHMFQLPSGRGIMQDIDEDGALLSLYSKNPAAFAKMEGVVGKTLRNCIGALSIKEIGELFASNPEKVASAFAQMNAATGNSPWAYYVLDHDKNISAEFVSWCTGSTSKEQFLAHLSEAMKKL